MEHWRPFFAQTDADLWTIIDRAIVLAATDFPEEFKRKRCEIAEILFERRPWPPERSMEATMLSGSVVTNATAHVQSGLCRQEVDTPKHVHTSAINVGDTHSRGSDSKTSAVDRHPVGHDHRNSEQDMHTDNREDFKTDNVGQNRNAVDIDHAVLQNVIMIKEKLIDPTNQNDEELLQSLQALEHLEIDVKILKATDIGREVNKFRKHKSGLVQSLAKQLVRTWKSMVDEWVKHAEELPPFDASAVQGIGKVDELDTKFHGNPSVNSTKTFMQMTEQQCVLQSTDGAATAGRPHLWGQIEAMPCCNEDFSLSGRKPCGEHVREEMGSSRVESDELDRPGIMEKRTEVSGYPAELSRCLLTKVNSDPGRPLASIPEVKRAVMNNSVAGDHRKDLAEKVRRPQNNQGDLTHKNGHGKFPAVHKLSTTDHLLAPERHQTTKRRLSNESHYTEHGKRQRDMQIATRPELSKGISVGAKVPASARSQQYNANKW